MEYEVFNKITFEINMNELDMQTFSIRNIYRMTFITQQDELWVPTSIGTEK